MIKCNYCTSEQKGDLPDGLIYTKNLKDFSPLFGESAMDIRFDEYDVCYALWSDHCETVEKKRLDFKYCPMCGRKLKPARGKYKYHSRRPKRTVREDFIFENRKDAEAFWSNLCEYIDLFGFASMFYAYLLVGVQPSTSDMDFGWTSLPAKAPITGTYSDGWCIKFPPFDKEGKEE